ncbi:alpha/beta hydrolase [Nitrosophilus kaiyonis]|uniref:alpha/beta hydrolase n=1 Tax=Nitrosophilus kaiyonis TaxID=2930200 RepID=UPI00248FEB7A|nr:alpha/beta hydrolase [Nitrosophilus kaiyonis]
MKYLAIAVVVLYFIAAIRVYLKQENEIFHPEKAPKNIVLEVKNLKKIEFKTSDNIILEGAFVENSKHNPLIIYFGGNSNNALAFLNVVKDINDFNFLVFNYRGYANSRGEPSQDKIFSDSIEIYDNFAKGKDVYLIGRSLGSSVATYLASKRDVKGLVLITPFDSILNLAKDKYPYLPMKFLLKHPFETYKYMEYVRTPVAIINVENDEVIPFKHYLNLERYIKNLAFKAILKDTTHMAVFTHPDFVKTLKNALDVLRRLN